MIDLREKLRETAAHALVSWLFSLGMTLTLLGVTGLLCHGWLAAAVLAALTAVICLAGSDRRIAVGSGCIVLFAGLVWMALGGVGLITEVMQALLLHMSGLTTALPMVGAPFAVIICVLCTAVSWFLTQRGAGAFPALILLVLAAVLLWLGSWTEVLVCLMPAAAAVVTLLFRAGDEHTGTLRVLPLAVVVTALAFTGVAAGGAVSRPLKELADDIRQRIYDTFFYTQPRDVFTLATEGYYPQGMGQLGGPADPREEPVMAVITPRKAYLRGVVKNVYTGRAWLEDIGGRRYLWSAGRFEEIRTRTFDQELPLLRGAADDSVLATRTLQARMLRDSASTMFAPQRIRSLSAEEDLIPYFNASSEIFATSNLELGDVWTMEAALFTANDAGTAALVSAAATADDPGWEAACDEYLQLPEHLQSEVYEIAAQAVQGAQSPYEKAMALQHYLASNYTYTLDAPEQNPEQDFVSSFLLIGREGYCTYFASAMTVLCRMAGLPARYVEGYVAYPDAEGLAIVTGKEGHAWTEVYFRGFGWVTFDATPTSAEYTAYPPDMPSGGADSDEPEQTPEPTAEPTSTPEPQDTSSPAPEPSAAPDSESTPVPEDQPSVSAEPESQAGTSAGLLWVVLLALAALLIAVRTVLVQPAMQVRRRRTEFGRWLVWVQATHDALRRHGLIRKQSETPAAFLERAAASAKVSGSIRALAEAENLMFYGHADPLAEETAAARDGFLAVYRALNARQKLLFQLQRICVSGRRFDITEK